MKSILKLVLVLFFSTTSASLVLAEDRPRLGWVEKVRVYPEDILIHAKLDTGADSSSLGAYDVEEFEKAGKTWVRFSVENRYGRSQIVERPLKRIAHIKRHHGRIQRRRMVRVGVCLGKTYVETDVTLIDRSVFHYQMLLGRVYLAGKAVIDPALTYMSEPNCRGVFSDDEAAEKENTNSNAQRDASSTSSQSTTSTAIDSDVSQSTLSSVGGSTDVGPTVTSTVKAK